MSQTLTNSTVIEGKLFVDLSTPINNSDLAVGKSLEVCQTDQNDNCDIINVQNSYQYDDDDNDGDITVNEQDQNSNIYKKPRPCCFCNKPQA